MPFRLKSVVPWGRSFEEYVAMFNLSDEDLSRKIVGCADGPASFNRKMHEQGNRVISCDPLYQFSRHQIEQRMQEARVEVMQQVVENRANFTWENIRSPAELEQVRLRAMQEFLEDYRAGRRDGRYLACALPDLPFRDRQFNLALCSHFLFLYPEPGLDFHLRAVLEMVRVADEVRIYPTVDINCARPSFFSAIVDLVNGSGFHAVLEEVRYNFLRNGTTMLKISR